MIKYIKVDWPNSQNFTDYNDEIYWSDDQIVFVPEDLYNKVINISFNLPEEYKNNFITDFNRIRKGLKVLIKDLKKKYNLLSKQKQIGKMILCLVYLNVDIFLE